jgi:outer membrane receptor protein involved in Fe transport
MKLIIYSLAVALFMSLNSVNAQVSENKTNSSAQPANKVISGGKISGKVIDSKTKAPIEYSNVILYKADNSTMINGTISTNGGSFMLDKIPEGSYFLKISFMGYGSKTIDNIEISSSQVDIGKIELDPESLNLDEVVVKGEKEMISYNLDKKVISVDKNITSSGGTALDVMQNIPSVDVDANGGVSLRGNSNLTILIDGKPSSLSGLSSNDILTQIPASSIENIELVTNPSAKYDPDGTAGIINIVLKKQNVSGINGVLSLNAGTGERLNSSANFNWKNPGFNIFGSYDGNLNKMNYSGTSERTSSISGVNSLLSQNSDGTNNFRMQNINLGADYFLDYQNSLSLNFRLRSGDFNSNNSTLNSNYETDLLTKKFDRANDSKRGFDALNYTLSYKKTFDTKSQEFTADVLYSDAKMTADGKTDQNYFDTITDDIYSSIFQKSNSKNTNKMWVLQANYIQPFESWGRIETGVKSNIKNVTMRNDYLDYNNFTSDWQINLLSQNYFDYKEQIHAGYLIYTNEISDFKYQFGLRGEQVFINGNLINRNEKFSNDYFSLYPTIHLGYIISKTDEIQLSYSRRVDRPSNRQLNPFIDYSDSLNIFSGNPKLNPQYINSYELGYSTFIGNTSLNSNLFFKETKGLISTVSTLQSNGVTFSTYKNIAQSSSYGVEFIASTSLLKWWKLNGNVSYFNIKIDDNSSLGLNQSSNSWTAKLNSNMTLWEDIQLQIIGSYSSPSVLIMGGGFMGTSVTAQTKMKEQYYVDAAIRKDFLQGKLSLTLRVSDIFNSRNFNSTTEGLNFSTISNRKNDTRVAYLGISYRLGGFSQKQEKPKSRLDEGMDDL